MLIHQFNAEVALRYGLEEAIVADQMNYLFDMQDFSQCLMKEEGFFYRIKIRDLEIRMPYLSSYRVNMAVKSLMNKGAVLVTNFDNNTWYALSDDFLNVLKRR